MFRKRSRYLIATALLTTAVSSAAAQTGPPPGWITGPGFSVIRPADPTPNPEPPGATTTRATGDPSPWRSCIEANSSRIARVAAVLLGFELKPEQFELWDALDAALSETIRVMANHCTDSLSAAGTPLPKALSNADALLELRRRSLQRVAAPLIALYETLSPEHRDIIDRRLAIVDLLTSLPAELGNGR